MALHISRLRIVNFRNFAECEIDPFPAPAVIVGENGVGKSNLMHALRLVLDPDLPDSARRLRAEDVHDGATGPLGAGLSGGAEVVIEVELSGFDNDKEALSVLSDALTHMDEPKRARLVYRFAPTDPLEVDASTGEIDKLQGSETPSYKPSDYDYQVSQGLDEDRDAGRVRRYVSLRVLPALRDAEGDLARWHRSPLRTLLEELDLDPSQLEAVAADIDLAADKLAQEPQIDDLQRRLGSRLKDLVGPQLPVEPRVGIISKDPDSLLRGLRLFVDAARTRSVADTSLGAANILYLGMLMEALTVRRAASAFVTTILGVEEPEAHLHVAVQRRLFRHLLKTEPALLLTTHSPHIAAVAPLETLVLLRSTASETVASTTLNAGLEKREILDISRYLDISRAELLFARYVILVEGSAETFLLPAVARSAGFDLDEYGVVLVNVAGTDFSPYLQLLGAHGLDLPCVVLTDGDPLRGSIGPPEQGLRRAAKLLDDQPLTAAVEEKIAKLVELEENGQADEALELRRELQNTCADENVFVGDDTLEIDLLPLVGDELIAAFSELVGSRKSANMARDVSLVLAEDGLDGVLSTRATNLAARAGAERSDRSQHHQRVERVLSRIENRGKGRVAQRWAGHVETLNLRTRVLDLLEVAGVDVSQEVLDGEAAVDNSLLTQAGAARASLRALDWASQAARGLPLLPATEEPDAT